jgi:hypothetical protein
MKTFFDASLDEILNFELTPEMFEDEYFCRHADQLLGIVKKWTAFSDLRKGFPWYSETLDEEHIAKLNRLRPLYANGAMLIAFKLQSFGISQDGAVPGIEVSDSMKESARLMLPEMTERFKNSSQRYMEDTQEAEWKKDILAALPYEKTREAASAFTKLHAQQAEEFAACAEALKDEYIKLMGADQWKAFEGSRQYAGARLRMDPALGRAGNLRRLRSEICLFRYQSVLKGDRVQALAFATDPAKLAEAQVAYDEIKAGVQDEMLNTLNYIGDLELTEAELIVRADELLRTGAALRNLSDAGNIVNPATNRSMKQELFGESAAILNTVRVVLAAYISIIRGSALALEDDELEANRDEFALREEQSKWGDQGIDSTRTFLRKERDKGVRLLASLKDTIADIAARLREDTLPSLPDGVPAPLYRAPGNS